MIESYIRSLDVAIGDRLPSEVKAQRLREAEGHLRMAAAELNQLEAVRRYGGARAVANAMVRVHKGYETASVWRLSLPLIGTMLLWHQSQWPIYRLLPDLGDEKRMSMGLIVKLLSLLSLALFVTRVVQTRRWLFWPVQICEFALVLCGAFLNRQFGHRSTLSLEFLWTSGVSCLIFFAINASVLGVASLADRRRVRRA
jgi:hypothetical protein